MTKKFYIMGKYLLNNYFLTALPKATFGTKSNVYDSDFFAKIVNKLTFFTKKALP